MLERPFLGSLLAYLPIVDSEHCSSFDTDAERIYVNLRAVGHWDEQILQFSLAHLTLHCALGHFHRRGLRERRRWHAACDYAVNQLLVEDGLPRPRRALWEARFKGLCAEEIYAAIGPEPVEHPADWSPGDPAFGPEWWTPSHQQHPESDCGQHAGDVAADERALDALRTSWRQRVAASAAAFHGRRGFDKTWGAFAGIALPERLPWRTVLARFMAGVTTEDFSYARPSRRESAAILPGRASRVTDLVVAIDTSGSIDASQQEAFLIELRALKAQVRARLTLLACDQALAEGAPWCFEPHEPISIPQSLGGGRGTRFTPVFDWVDRQGSPPDALVYLTDAVGEFPARTPGYPVLWVVKGPAPVPWGERITLD